MFQLLAKNIAFCAILSWATANQNNVPVSDKDAYNPSQVLVSPVIVNTDDSLSNQERALLEEVLAPLLQDAPAISADSNEFVPYEDEFASYKDKFAPYKDEFAAYKEQFVAYKFPKKCPKKVIAPKHLKVIQAPLVKQEPTPSVQHKVSATEVHQEAIVAPIEVVVQEKKPEAEVIQIGTSPIDKQVEASPLVANDKQVEASPLVANDKEVISPVAIFMDDLPSVMPQKQEPEAETVPASFNSDSSPLNEELSAAPEYVPSGYYVSKPVIFHTWII